VRFQDGDRAWTRWLPEERTRLMGNPDPDRRRDVPTAEAEWDGRWLSVEVLKSRRGLSRQLGNQRVDHVKRVFRWAASEELVPASVQESLRTVAGLRRGHAGTYERPKVKPVPQKHVEAVLPLLCPQVAAMVRLQQLTGARPTEICLLRGCHLDRSG